MKAFDRRETGKALADYTDSEQEVAEPYVKDEVEFLAEARRLYQFDCDCDSDDREAAEDDNRFANASDSDTGQWAKEAIAMRSVPGAERPIQQWNRIPTYVQQVVNDGRQNKPAIRITPDDGGSKETAELFQERIRHIEYETNADTAYDTARDQQVTSGRGFVRIDTEYIPGTFKQRICIQPIENQFSVIWDSASRLYDRSDATRCFVISRISRDQHIREYGKDSVVSRMEFDTNWENPAPSWIGVGTKGDLIQIAEYWCKEFKKRKLCNILGLPIWKDTLTADQYKTFKANGQIWDEREEDFATICQYTINGAEILAKREWIGTTIPIVPFWGRIAVVDGKRRTFSLIRNAKDPQRLVNLYVSNIAEQIAQMPKSPYLTEIGSIPANMEDDWAQAANSPKGFLGWLGWDTVNNRPFTKPTRVVNEPPIQALTIGLQQAIEGIKAAMGIYDASLGARSNETSGVAIDQRRKSAEIVNFHFPDNESRSRKRVGQILVELIPILDKSGSNVTVRAEDGKTRTVPIGKPFQDPKTGKTITHVLTDGDYGVNVSDGPSFQTQREETYKRDAELIKADPELMYAIGPQMLRADDSAGAEDRAQALERFINIKFPGLIPPKPEDGKPPIPPEVQHQVQQMQQELQQTQAFAKSLHEQIQTKQPEIQSAAQIKAAELETQIKLKQMDLDFQREKLAVDDQNAKLKVASVEGIEELQQQIAVLMDERQKNHELMQQQTDHAQAAELQKAQQDHAATTQDTAQAHEADQSQADRDAAAEAAETAQQAQEKAATEGAE